MSHRPGPSRRDGGGEEAGEDVGPAPRGAEHPEDRNADLALVGIVDLHSCSRTAGARRAGPGGLPRSPDSYLANQAMYSLTFGPAWLR